MAKVNSVDITFLIITGLIFIGVLVVCILLYTGVIGGENSDGPFGSTAFAQGVNQGINDNQRKKRQKYMYKK